MRYFAAPSITDCSIAFVESPEFLDKMRCKGFLVKRLYNIRVEVAILQCSIVVFCLLNCLAVDC